MKTIDQIRKRILQAREAKQTAKEVKIINGEPITDKFVLQAYKELEEEAEREKMWKQHGFDPNSRAEEEKDRRRIARQMIEPSAAIGKGKEDEEGGSPY